jgi:hypothetical protein
MKSAVSPVRVQRALSAAALLAFVRQNGLSRAELELVIEDLATAKRAPGKTRQEGYDDFVTPSPIPRLQPMRWISSNVPQVGQPTWGVTMLRVVRADQAIDR